MIDPIQTILLFVIIILTALLFALGIQVFLILRELRRTVSKANKVLDDTSIITQSVSGPVASLTSLSSGLKIGTLIAKILQRSFKSSKKSKKDDLDE